MESKRMATLGSIHFGRIPQVHEVKYKYSTSRVIRKENHAEIVVGDKVALIDLEDVEKISSRRWNHTKSNGVMSNKRWYEREKGKSGHFKLHRIITNAPKGMDVDHINGDTLDNRRSNLRVVTHGDNMVNTPSRPMRNIEFSNGSYCVRIDYKKERHYVGRYKELGDAVKARDEAATRIHGDLRKR